MLMRKRDYTFNWTPVKNPGILMGKMPDDMFLKVRKAVKDPSARLVAKKTTHTLVCLISNEYDTIDIPELNEYVEAMYHTYCTAFQVPLVKETEKKIWTNYMKKGEFNPNHNHPNTLAAFVFWVQIPYNIEDEVKYNGYDNQSYPSRASCFEFTYTTMVGKIVTQPIWVEKGMEGTMIMFPGDLIHCVYPFFTSDDERISIAGNIYSKEYMDEFKRKNGENNTRD